jgi:hypothetical protein
MKGIVGAERAKTYTPSAYGGGDRGGSAGGYGIGHGAMGGGSGGAAGGFMPSFGYQGAALGIEGGVRAGGVSEPETMPGQYPYSKKGTVHGVSGVEGINAEPLGANAHPEGHGCGHGCGMFKTQHGLARHALAKHGFSGMKKAMSHGDSYGGKQTRGETEGPKEWEENEHEWSAAKSKVDDSEPLSSFSSGDSGGSYSKMKKITG